MTTAKERIKQVFVSFSDMMASCKNDDFLEDFHKGTLLWLNKAEQEVLQILKEQVIPCHCGVRKAVHCTICRDRFARNSVKDAIKKQKDKWRELLKLLLEPLAELEHLQWSHWTRYFLEFDNPSNRKGWKRQAHLPYNKLTEKEKESDREWARQVLQKIEEKLEKIEQ